MEVENLKEVIKKSRPSIKDSTIKSYEANLNKLKKMFDSDNYNFLKDVDKVMEKIGDKHFTTIRNYLNAIIILLLALNHDDKYEELLKEYQSKRDDLNQQYEDENATGKISDKQKENFIPYEDLVKMINEMGKDLKGFKKRELSAKDKMLLQIYIIYQIHIRLPMRNDLSGMEAINKRTYNKLSEEDKKAKNYLVIEKGKMFMVLNKFKTQSKYEELRFDVPKDLERLLRSYLKINGMGVLFKSSTGKALTRNQLSQLLIKFSKKYIGKSISTTMLRKIVLSHKFGDLKKEQEEMSKITGHSVGTMNNVYIKEGNEDKS
jgi:hypothetical protein